MSKFQFLFRPLSLKGVTIRNRIVMAPMNTNFAESDGSVSEQFTKYFVERGKGGVGLIITCSAYIDPAAKKRSGGLLLHEDRFIPKMKEFTSAIHKTGAKVFQQLTHNGRLVSSSKELKTAITGGGVGPSPVPHLLTGVIPHALTISEIKELIEKFGQAGRRAKEAGFDGVEIHGTHGYLINEFFSLYSNRRTDEYGGSLENRLRFPVEVYRRVRELTGADFLVAYRLNAREFAPIETPFEDVIALCQRLEEEGIDILDMSLGNGETPSMALKFMPPASVPRGHYAYLSAAIKREVKVPVITVVRINTPEIAEEILSKGKADLVAVGRGLIADPYFPAKALRGESARIRRCVACNQGCLESLAKEKKITCLYNPEVGREGELQPTSKRKKVWIVGGGPGGMEAARIASLRGHDVSLFEKEKELGGQGILAALPPGRQEFNGITDFLIGELKWLNVSIHLNEEMTPEKMLKGYPEVVILATGSTAFIPDIPGIRQDNVVLAEDVLRGKKVMEKVLVAGGGLVGVETALFLSKEGKEVVLIHRRDEMGKNVGPFNQVRLQEELEATGIKMKCKTELLSIGEKRVRVRGEEGEYEIPTETVVLALGARAWNPLFHLLEGKVPELYAIGDCVTPRKMLEATHEAYDVASKI